MAARKKKATKWREGDLRGMSIGSKYQASTAWVQYEFNEKQNSVNIQIYRYSWIVWERKAPLSKFFHLRAEAVEWCKTWKFQYVRERVLQTISERTVLKHQDGTPLDGEPPKKTGGGGDSKGNTS